VEHGGVSNRLDGKRVLVTGGATGIGRAAALHMAGEGARIAILDINDAAAEETAAAPGRIRYWHADVVDREQVSTALTAAQQWWPGPPEVLVHAAGVLEGAGLDIEEFPDDTWEHVLDVNLHGSFLMSKHVIPKMLANGGGVVILLASGAGVRGGSSSFAYGSSKGGVHGLALVLEHRYAAKGIRVHDVCPGNIETPLKSAQLRASLERSGDRESYERQVAQLSSSEELAPLFTFLASDEAQLVTGTIFTK
jgi:NAD(P)-dependent dehydrogenase (short-subunit alcohol dehydrogenase family)